MLFISAMTKVVMTAATSTFCVDEVSSEIYQEYYQMRLTLRNKSNT
jgi:hypothetical protein